MRVTNAFWIALGICFGAQLSGCAEGVEETGSCSDGPGKLFEQKVKPLLTSDHVDSCSECHAAGVTLSQFVRGTECEAMACLKKEGLVDLNNPENSVLLSWIGRAEPRSDLITAEIVEQEREAFLQWFRYEAECESCAQTVCPDEGASVCDRQDTDELQMDQESDPGDCTRETLERLFRGTVYGNRDRCAPCHLESSTTATKEAPRFFADYGTCQVASLATMLRVLDAGYINTNMPPNSLLLTKPLSVSEGGVEHGGHDKFYRSDQTYQDFLYFAERYADCKAQQNSD